MSRETLIPLIIKCYLVLINLAGFLSMGADKRKAVKKLYRIPEKTLFLLAILGGSVGSIIGMYHFRHKTKHKSFVYGLPAILIIQSVLVLLFLTAVFYN